MIPELERRSMLGGNEVFSFWDDSEKEIDVLLGEHQHQQRYHGDGDEIERELNLYRSGSAPPTVDSSLNASRGLFNGRGGGAPFLELGGVNNENNEFSKDPSYLSYCYDNTKLNPRLPPPLMSREDLRVAQRLKESSNVFGDMRNGNESQSLFSMPLGFEQMKKQQELEAEKNSASSSEWDANGLSSLDIGGKKKSFADIFQDDMGHSHLSCPASRNAFDENVDSARNQSLSAICAPSQYSYAAVLGSSLSRNGTPDPQIIARVPSPCLTPIGSGRASSNDKRNASNQSPFNGLTSGLKESSDLAAALGGMNLSSNGGLNGGQAEQDVENVRNYMFGHNEVSQQTQHLGSAYNGGVGLPGPYKSDQASNATHSWRNSQLRGSQDSAYNGGVGLPGPYQHLDSPNYSLNSYTLDPSVAPSKMASQIGNNNFSPSYNDVYGMDSRLHGGGFVSSGQNLLSESHNLGRVGHRMMGGDAGLPSHVADPMYHQYARFPENSDLLNGPSMDMSLMGSSYMNMLELQRAYLGAQKPHYGGVPYKSRSPNSHSYYGSPAFGSNMLYPDSPLAHHVMSNSLVAPLSPRGEVNMRYPSATRNYAGGIMGSRHIDASLESLDESFGSSLLEEFKRDKTRGFELYEIAGHVGEFSGDQFGSRFIQQKLETATTDEKNMIYEEIMPQALTLMTDVFGNYVIQKFFELGLPAHRREIAEKLFSKVLSLSLQMYGCRVIQKAIEVVDLDQKIMMVKELEGHVMRCVRDQNGNHVVQKCIECVPEENIDFILSTFFGHIVTLSTHPYGCRVIQRVLEYCHDMDTQRKVMEEILSSVSLLAQDQYGNYVIQHVLEHGKTVERTVIIKELAGNMVLMSQQKYASNVVEKCLTFGGPEERELLVNEMMGTTDENEPLQAMMKDQFANYVVQKVLEMCDDQHRELILGRIKVHLDALKKYTYGKHIVARVEKLVAAGERRMASQSLNQHKAA